MWSHQYDSITRNRSAKRMRIVLDLYTNQDFFFYDLNNVPYTDLYVKARNLNRELAFIDFDNDIKISLGDLEKNYPKVYLMDCSNCRFADGEKEIFSENCENSCESEEKSFYHVKLEIDYTIYDIKFRRLGIFNGYKFRTFLKKILLKLNKDHRLFLKKILLKLNKEPHSFLEKVKKLLNKIILTTGYESYSYLPKSYQKEVHLNIPKGLDLVEESLEITLKEMNNANRKTDSACFKIDKPNYEIACNKDALINRYTAMIIGDEYLPFVQKYNPEDIVTIIKYETKNYWLFYLINAFALAVFLLNFHNLVKPGPTEASSLIALISFFVLYLTLIREGYVFALNKLIFASIVISGLLFVFTYTNGLHGIISSIAYNLNMLSQFIFGSIIFFF